MCKTICSFNHEQIQFVTMLTQKAMQTLGKKQRRCTIIITIFYSISLKKDTFDLETKMESVKKTCPYCSHHIPLGEAGATDRTNILNPDITDGGPAGDKPIKNKQIVNNSSGECVSSCTRFLAITIF